MGYWRIAAIVIGITFAPIAAHAACVISPPLPDAMFDATAGALKYCNGSTLTTVGGQWTVTGSDIYFNTGKVGIGTTTPTSALHVVGTLTATSSLTAFKLIGTYGSSTAYLATSASANDPAGASGGLQIINSNSSDQNFSEAYLKATNTAGIGQSAYIAAVSNTGASYTPSIVIGQQTGATSYAERMRIDTNGNVGIGTTTPVTQLQVGSNLANSVYTPYLASFGGTYTGSSSQSGVEVDSRYNPGTSVSTVQSAVSSASILTGSSSANSGSNYAFTGFVQNSSSNTLSNAMAFVAQTCLNSGGTISSCYGFYSKDQTGGSSNYGYYSAVTSGSNKWGFYAAGSADNYFNGNVGIGTTSPATALTLGAGGVLRAYSTDNTKYLEFYHNGSNGRISSSFGELLVDTGFRVSTVNINSTGIFGSVGSGLSLGANGSAGTLFISSSNNVGIGTTTPGMPLEVQGAGGVGQIRLRNTGAAGGAYWNIGPDTNNNIIVYSQAGTGVYVLNGGTSWGANSDRRLKTNIETLSPTSGLAAILRLNPVTFRWKSVTAPSARQTGFIAQEVQQVLPDLVEHAPDTTIEHADGSEEKVTDTLGLNYTGFVVPLVKAVQELNAQANAMRAANDNMAAENAVLRKQVDHLTTRMNFLCGMMQCGDN